MRDTSRLSNLNPAVAVWQEQIGLAVNTPYLKAHGMRDCDELLPRVAAYYTYLKALPRRVRRALQRQWRMPLAGLALMLALGQSPALAATIPVNATCTLINAITAANTDTATGGCPAGSGADTVVLPPGSTQTLTQVNNSTYGPTGLPVISSTITIQGQGSTIARNTGAPGFRVLAVGATGDLMLQDTTVTGGIALAPEPPAHYYGGGVANFLGGTLTLLNSSITGNTAEGGGGVANFLGGMLTLLNSSITGNTATFAGGGVRNFGGNLNVFNSTVTGNTAGAHSGGIGDGGGYAGGGIVSILSSTISGNFTYRSGGGVGNFGGTLTVLNTTIAENTAYYDGGGVHNGGTMTLFNSTIVDNTGGVYGGGVANLSYGTLTVTNSTISGNFTNGTGGAVENAGALTILNSTILGNTAVGFCYYDVCYFGGGGVSNYGQLTLTRTIVSGNTAPVTPEIINPVDSGGAVSADNHNLFGLNGNAGVVGFSPGPTDIVPPAGVQLSNILNPVLAFNGGPTQTHALVPGSPAIDAGGPLCLDANGNPLLTDQSGKPRIIDGNGDGTARCDIGAFEFFPVVNNLVTLDPALDTSFNPTPVPNAPAGTFTIGATFTNTSNRPLRFPFFTVTELSKDNLLLNADEGTQGVGATVTPNVGDQVLSPGETVQVEFVIGLQTSTPFTFFVDLFAEPLVSGAATSRHRPNVTTKGGRR